MPVPHALSLFMPSPQTAAVFLLAALVLLLIPGPAVVNIVTCSIVRGRHGGLACVLGTELAALLHAAAAALGLSALLATSALAFGLVKYLGAAYLVYLGVQAFRRADTDVGSRPRTPQRFSGLLAQGFAVNLLNPKTALFFLAFLPQFADPAKGALPPQILVFGALFVALAFCTDGAYALIAGTAGRWLQARAAAGTARRYVTGGVYIGLGVAAAFAGAKTK